MAYDPKSVIEKGQAILGIEFGSTRIKAVLIDPEYKPIAQGSHTWENQLVNGLWTYSVESIWFGLQDCYSDLRKNVLKQYEVEIENLAAIGISAMMHGYMPFDKHGDILVPFPRRVLSTSQMATTRTLGCFKNSVRRKRPWMPMPIMATLRFSPGLSSRAPTLEVEVAANVAAAAEPKRKLLRLMSIILFTP